MDADKREAGRHLMAQVYGWDQAPDVSGDFMEITTDHLFGEIWARAGLSIRDRRLLLLGLLIALGEKSVMDVQLDAALKNGELSPDELREIVIFLTHYAGWPRGAAFYGQVEAAIGRNAQPGSA